MIWVERGAYRLCNKETSKGDCQMFLGNYCLNCVCVCSWCEGGCGGGYGQKKEHSRHRDWHAQSPQVRYRHLRMFW